MVVAENSRCFEGGEHQYYWRDLAAFWRRTMTDGVVRYDQMLYVYGDSSGMQVKVKTGEAFIQGYWYALTKAQGDADKVLSITNNTSGVTRYDRVILRLDTDPGVESISLRVGVGSGGVPPTLVRSGTIYEISLAQVVVVNGAVTIAANNIIDERLDYTYCGITGCTVFGHLLTDPPTDVSFEGQPSYCWDTNKLQLYDGSGWRTLVDDIDAAAAAAVVDGTSTVRLVSPKAWGDRYSGAMAAQCTNAGWSTVYTCPAGKIAIITSVTVVEVSNQTKMWHSHAAGYYITLNRAINAFSMDSVPCFRVLTAGEQLQGYCTQGAIHMNAVIMEIPTSIGGTPTTFFENRGGALGAGGWYSLRAPTAGKATVVRYMATYAQGSGGRMILGNSGGGQHGVVNPNIVSTVGYLEGEWVYLPGPNIALYTDVGIAQWVVAGFEVAL